MKQIYSVIGMLIKNYLKILEQNLKKFKKIIIKLSMNLKLKNDVSFIEIFMSLI